MTRYALENPKMLECSASIFYQTRSLDPLNWLRYMASFINLCYMKSHDQKCRTPKYIL